MCERIKSDYSKSKITEFMDELKEKMPFQNEAQFQHALAMAIDKDIAENNKPYEVLLEVWTGRTPGEDQSDKRDCYTDIVIFDATEKEYLAIELKYKTAGLTVTKDYGEIHLKQQSANDYGCYDYLWDVQRIQDLILGENKDGNLEKCSCVGGYAIFLTNERLYWEYKREERMNKNGYYDFCIGDGNIETNQLLEWHSPRDSQKEGMRKSAIQLGNCLLDTQFEWKPFRDIPQEQCQNPKDAREFRYLCLELAKPASR